MKNFTQHFVIIKDKFIREGKTSNLGSSDMAFAKFLGHGHDGKVKAWKKGQWPSAADLAVIEKKLGFNLRWLVTGEGEPEGPDTPTYAASAPVGITPALPIVGLAACGVMGLEQIMPFAVTASPVVLGPRAVAVVASGDSMVPAGIASGQMCFCDPDQEPLEGEAVFLRLKDETGALKLYLGRAEREGFHKFKGWLPKINNDMQKAFDLEINELKIDYIAPVVLVRRRL